VKAAGDTILFQLKSLGEAQAEMLARRLGISVQAVRQRLERLLTENLVAFFRSRAWSRPATSAVVACAGNGIAVSRYPCPAHDPQRTRRDRIGEATRKAP
jgi:DNA-binding Lrp family transcriptional regulator